MIYELDGDSMTAYEDKSISLIERKKRQWAREKDELENLWAPWENRTSNQWPLSSRGQHTKIATILSQSSNRRESFSSQNSYRKSSLPPLSKTQSLSKDRLEREGETSGYASDNPIHPGYLSQTYSGNPNNSQCGYESSSSRDDRSRWKNKVMPSNWESKDSSRSNEITNDPPNWLKRGLEQEGHIEVTNSSPSESPEQEYIEHDRPLSGTSSEKSRTHIRGQNIRLDSVELAERERKREIALQHQQAIRQQLEERERKRSEERRRRIREEYEEELRIAKEQQLERKRLEDEQKLLQKKHEKEEKRKEAMKKAIELAENEAKLQKMKLKMLKQQKNNINVNNDFKEFYPTEIPTKERNGNEEAQFECRKEKSNLTPRNTSVTKLDEKDKENWNNMQPAKIENRTTEIIIKNNLETENSSKENQNNSNDNVKNCSKPTQQKNEPVTIVIPTNFETLQHFQYAVLMSLPSSSSVPVAVPLAVASENTQSYTATRTENRILTPTQYRQKNKLMCDSSTQTEELRVEKFCREKNTNMEGIYENRSRKGRNSSRNENVSDRPKWGANRPPTRYLKQSEKDLVYQRKKSRQKNEENLYDDKNSSDESQMATPRYRKRNHLDKRHPRPMWRKHTSEDVFSRNVRMYQSEIIPIEADKNNVCFEHRCCCKCRCIGKLIVESSADILTVNHGSPKDQISRGSNLIDDPNRTGDELPSLPNEEMD